VEPVEPVAALQIESAAQPRSLRLHNDAAVFFGCRLSRAVWLSLAGRLATKYWEVLSEASMLRVNFRGGKCSGLGHFPWLLLPPCKEIGLSYGTYSCCNISGHLDIK